MNINIGKHEAETSASVNAPYLFPLILHHSTTSFAEQHSAFLERPVVPEVTETTNIIMSTSTVEEFCWYSLRKQMKQAPYKPQSD